MAKLTVTIRCLIEDKIHGKAAIIELKPGMFVFIFIGLDNELDLSRLQGSNLEDAVQSFNKMITHELPSNFKYKYTRKDVTKVVNLKDILSLIES